MATRIRLRRMGAKKRPYYRVVVADQRAPRDGRFIENIGKYHPLEDPSLIEIDEERALHWLRTGAQPSEQVQNLMTKIGIWEKFAAERPGAAKVNSKDKKVREGRPEAPKTSKKAQAKAAETASAAADPAPTVAQEPAPSQPEEPAAEVQPTPEEPPPAPTPEAAAAPETAARSDAETETDTDA
ncbi:MAG: 30S ribosomal protein S16 [Actinomycetota bacterium]